MGTPSRRRAVRHTPGLIGAIARAAAMGNAIAPAERLRADAFSHRSETRRESDARKIVALTRLIESLQADQAESSIPKSVATPPATGIADQLATLASLRSQGILSRAEYEMAKALILA